MAPLDSYMTQEELDQYVDAYIDEGRFDQEENLKIFPGGEIHRGVHAEQNRLG